MNDNSNKELFKALAPYLVGTALSAVFVVLLLFKFVGPTAMSASSPQIVTFDVIRFANAQRAVASTFLTKNADQLQATELLQNLSQRTRQTISEVAGKGTLVMLKQAVVQGQTRDITDDVLKKLGLPTTVPTQDGVEYQIDMAPTMWLRVPAAIKPQPLPGETTDAQGKVLP